MLNFNLKKVRVKREKESWGLNTPMMKVNAVGENGLQKIEFNPACMNLFGWNDLQDKNIGIGNIDNKQTVFVFGEITEIQCPVYTNPKSENFYIYNKKLGEDIRKEFSMEGEFMLELSINTEYTTDNLRVVNLNHNTETINNNVKTVEENVELG